MKYWQPYGISDPDAPYINGDPSIGRAGSIPPAGSIEQDQREIVNTIKGAGFTPTETDVSQLLVAVRSQRMNYAVATNTAPNSIAVAFYPPLGTSLTSGLPLRVKPPLNNTGPSTLIVDGVSNPLRRSDGSELSPDDIVAHIPFECLWNDTGYWVMTNYRGAGAGGGGSTTYITKIPYTTDVGTPNHIIANFTPPITAPVPGDAIEVRLANNITGACGIVINGLPEVSVVRPNGTAMQNGDGVVDQVALMLRANNGTWQFTGVIPQAFSGFTMPVGSLVFTLGSAALPGTLKLNGAMLNRAAHPLLWAFANASNRIVDETLWQTAGNRVWTSFSRGDGTSTFRLPELRGEFPRFWDDGRGVDSGRVLGAQQDFLIGAHTHTFNLGLPPYGKNLCTTQGNAWMVGATGETYFTYLMNDIFLGTGLVTDSTGGNDNRPRNTNIVPCMVDG